jgi:asparagine synthase (glutamine-hydrolysing)
MCGICGSVSLTHALNLEVSAMSEGIAHRGPNAQGLWNNSKVSFAHRRLSLIDLSPLGNQPMVSVDGNLILVFNGEIYNFQEIRTELQSKGHVFRSGSDTEVVLYAYQEWGTKSFARFNGMFAIAMYDLKKDQVVLARDHAGIKPLYYHISEDRFIFSSEMRGFKAVNPNWEKDENWEIRFLSFGFIPAPFTTLRDVFMLPKGSFLTLEISDKIKSKLESFQKFSYSDTIVSEQEALEQVRETLLSAVNRHMIADAPLGIFLSGGIDSSLVALIADHLGHQDLNTLSITFDEATFSEEPYQNIVLAKMKPHHHRAYQVDESMFMDHLDDIFEAMDQPSWDGVNSYFISKCAQEAGLKAVLSGLGGDELFGGYPSFRRIGMLNTLSSLPEFVKSFARFAPNDAVARIGFLNAKTNYKDYLFLRGAFTPSTVAGLTGQSEKAVFESLANLNLSDYPRERNLNLAAYLESNIYMENQLLKDTDCMSMWHSLEVRVPFLDKELMELMDRIKPATKFNFSQPKYLLTKAFSDLLPDEIVFRKKQGFTFPFSIWLKNNMDHFKSLLPDTPETKKLVTGFLEGKVHWSRLWALMVWEKFKN